VLSHDFLTLHPISYSLLPNIHFKERKKLTSDAGTSGMGVTVLVWILLFGLIPAIRWSKKVMMAACTSFSSMAGLPRLIALASEISESNYTPLSWFNGFLLNIQYPG
jgi:hypothetical protein